LVQLTDNSVPDRLAEINDAGTIVWQEQTQANSEGDFFLMMYQDGATTQLEIGRSPRINNLGNVAWKRFNNKGCESSDANIFLHDGKTVEQITNNALSSQISAINDVDSQRHRVAQDAR
jgi:hypothetical protein